jgi:hypothetical protein
LLSLLCQAVYWNFLKISDQVYLLIGMTKSCSLSSMAGDRLLLAWQWCLCFCLTEGLDMSCKYSFILFTISCTPNSNQIYKLKVSLLCFIIPYHDLCTLFLVVGWLFVIILSFTCLSNNLLSLLQNSCCTWNFWYYLSVFSCCISDYL